jgi:hypothetical protein
MIKENPQKINPNLSSSDNCPGFVLFIKNTFVNWRAFKMQGVIV